MPYFFGLGFVEGAFYAEGVTSNVTECRIHSIRLSNNATLLAWYSQISYGVDKIMKYATGFLEESYPFGFHCYYTYDEAQQLATSDEFLNQGIDELLEDAAYEMRQHTDATRRIMKLLFEVYPER